MANEPVRHTDTQKLAGQCAGDKTSGNQTSGGGGGDVDELQQLSLKQVAKLCQQARDKGQPISLFNDRRLLRRMLAQATA